MNIEIKESTVGPFHRWKVVVDGSTFMSVTSQQRAKQIKKQIESGVALKDVVAALGLGEFTR